MIDPTSDPVRFPICQLIRHYVRLSAPPFDCPSVISSVSQLSSHSVSQPVSQPVSPTVSPRAPMGSDSVCGVFILLKSKTCCPSCHKGFHNVSDSVHLKKLIPRLSFGTNPTTHDLQGSPSTGSIVRDVVRTDRPGHGGGVLGSSELYAPAIHSKDQVLWDGHHWFKFSQLGSGTDTQNVYVQCVHYIYVYVLNLTVPHPPAIICTDSGRNKP